MNCFKFLFINFLLLTSFIEVTAQSQVKEISVRKGQILDVLFINNSEGSEQALQNYFKDVFPIAKKGSYKTFPGFGIPDIPLQGSYHPGAMAFGTWNDLESRDNTMKQIEKEIPDFHQRRREIWTTFNITYYQMEKDLTFTVNPEKINVVTSYWKRNDKSFGKFIQSWKRLVKNAGGQIIVKLANGDSPTGYMHNPDFMTITEWNDQDSFDAFYRENLSMDYSAVKHVNQFSIK